MSILTKMRGRSLFPIESLLDRAQGDTFSVPSLEKVGKSMASIGSLTVPIDFEITEVSKQVLKPLVAQVIGEVLEDSQAVIKSEEDLRAFVQAEVRKALKDVMREYEAEITEKGVTTTMGGRPSKGTSKDMRLSRNNPNAGKPAQPKPSPAPKKVSK